MQKHARIFACGAHFFRRAVGAPERLNAPQKNAFLGSLKTHNFSLFPKAKTHTPEFFALRMRDGEAKTSTEHLGAGSLSLLKEIVERAMLR